MRPRLSPRSNSFVVFSLACAALLGSCAQIIGIEDLPAPPPAADAGPCSGPDCPAACETSATCPVEAPLCDSAESVCKPCGELTEADAACAARDVALPYCTADGTCAACAENAHCTDASAPVCNAAALTCVGCQEHADCAAFAGVCDRDSGACFADSAILYVKQDVAESGATCSQSEPCQTIAEALALLKANNESKKVITFLDEAETTYRERIAPTQPPSGELLTFSIVGNQTRIQTPSGAQGNLVELGQRTHANLEKLVIEASDENGVHCIGANNSSVSIREAQVQDHAGVGVNVLGCDLRLLRSSITANESGGIKVTSSGFHIANNFIYRNGDSATSAVGGAVIDNNASRPQQVFAFNTVLGNSLSAAGVPVGVQCEVVGTAAMVNNIVDKGVFSSPAIGGNCVWSSSAIHKMDMDSVPEAIAPRSTNIDSNCGIVIDGSSLPRLSASSECRGLATANPEISIDYDGELRDPDAPDIGADEIVESVFGGTTP